MLIHKNDIKFLHIMDLTNITFYDAETEQLYNNYKNKPIIDYRIYDAIYQEYEYLDLSHMQLTNEDIHNLFHNHEILTILRKISLIDMSNNQFLTFPSEILEYKNIKNIIMNHNKIEKINIYDLNELDISDNNINEATICNVGNVIITNNKLVHINNIHGIEYIDCSYNDLDYIPYIEGLKYLTTNCKNISDQYNIDDIDVYDLVYCVKMK